MSALDVAAAGPPPTAAATEDGRTARYLRLAGLAVLILLAPAAVLYLSFDAGGYYPSTDGIVAIVLAQALVLRTVLADRPLQGIGWRLAIPLGALTAYAAWQLASALWSHAPARSLDDFDRTLMYILALTLYGSLANTSQRVRWLTRALVAAMAFVCIVGVITRTLPNVWPTSATFGNSRLNFPLTYWNAEGMLATVALLLLFHLGADEEEPAWVRVIAATLVPAVAVTLLLTFSRGALGVAVIGLVVYVVLARPRLLLIMLVAVGPVTAIALKVAWDAPLLATTALTAPATVAEGHHVAKVLLACTVAAAALRAVLLLGDRALAGVRLPVVTRTTAFKAAASAGTLAVVVIVLLAVGAPSYASRQYHRFVNGNAGPQVAQLRDRLTDPANDGRIVLWRAAKQMFEREPLHGTGADTFQVYWTQLRTPQGDYYVTDTHNLYLQALAQLGIVGLALLAVVVLGLLGGILQRMRGRDRTLYAALFAAALAWAIHSAVDWDWQMPAVTIWLFCLGGLALARAPTQRRYADRPRSRLILAVGWLLVAVVPFFVSISYSRLHDAAVDVKQGNCVAARQKALSSISYEDVRPDAFSLIGVCDLEQGFPIAAVPAMQKAVSLDRQNWQEEFWLATAQAAAGQDPHAAAARALALNPLEPLARELQHALSGNDPRVWEADAPKAVQAAIASGRFAVSAL